MNDPRVNNPEFDDELCRRRPIAALHCQQFCDAESALEFATKFALLCIHSILLDALFTTSSSASFIPLSIHRLSMVFKLLFQKTQVKLTSTWDKYHTKGSIYLRMIKGHIRNDIFKVETIHKKQVMAKKGRKNGKVEQIKSGG